MDALGRFSAIFGSIVCNRAILYKRQNILKVVVRKIIIDQWNQTALLYEIQVTGIYGRTILVVVTLVRCKEGCL